MAIVFGQYCERVNGRIDQIGTPLLLCRCRYWFGCSDQFNSWSRSRLCLERNNDERNEQIPRKGSLLGLMQQLQASVAAHCPLGAETAQTPSDVFLLFHVHVISITSASRASAFEVNVNKQLHHRQHRIPARRQHGYHTQGDAVVLGAAENI